MKRYSSRVDALLRVRRVEEDLAAAALATSLRDAEIAAAALWRASDRFADRVDSLLRGGEPQDASRFVGARDLCLALAGSVSTRRTHATDAHAFAEHRRSAWMTTAQRVAGLEHLDERRRAEHRRDERRRETAIADDLTMMRGRRASTEREDPKREEHAHDHPLQVRAP